MFDAEGLTITKASKADWIGKGFHFNKKKDTIVIGGMFFGQTLIPCKDIKEFKVLDEKASKTSKKKAVGTVGGAVVGGILTGGLGAIIGGLAGGNKTEKGLKIDLGFKMKSKDWFVGRLVAEDKNSLTGKASCMVIEAIAKRLSVKEDCPF